MTHRRRRQLRPGAARDATDVGSEATLMIVNLGKLPTASSRRLPGCRIGFARSGGPFPTETVDAIGGNGDVAVNSARPR
jgi:hypothetical protein